MPDLWLHPDLEARPSPVAGHGLFTTAVIPAGTAVMRVVDGDLGTLNHGCDPNLGWVDDQTLETLREIASGEELLVDYATGIADPEFLLRCHCFSYRCRQMVEGTDWRIPQLQQRYAGHWAPRVQRLIDGQQPGYRRGRKSQA